jgi:hypothetical protein
VAIVGPWGLLVGISMVVIARLGIEVRLCIFKRITGLPCPSCGMTRGILAMLGGDLAGGWAFNPLGFSVLLACAALLVLRFGFGRRVQLTLTRRERTAAWLVGGGIFLANWVYVILFVG